jgi:hypothetical protein
VSITQSPDVLSEAEQAALDRLENQQARGISVRWEKPCTVKGFLARPIEAVTVKDYGDPTKMVEKKVATLRTAEGLMAIWSGPAALEALFEIEGAGMPVIVVYKGEKVGQESGRSYKDISVVIGEAPAVERSTDETGGTSGEMSSASAADDDIPF